MTEIKEDINILKFITPYDIKHSTALLESIRCLMVDEKSSKTAVTHINKQVANALSKELAFDLLIKILPDCAQSILDENSKAWVNYAVSKHQEEAVAACRFQFLVALYQRCHTNQEFYKTIVSNLLPKIIDTCVWVHVKSPEAQHALNCLYFTMKYFASACIVQKRKIEEFVWKFLDSSSKIATVLEAAKCHHILNQVGGAGPNGSIHIKNFEDSFEKLYKTLNILYDAMFENINEFRNSTPPEEIANTINFKEIPTYLGTMDVYKILSRRMENIVIFLIEMLQTDYRVKKTLKPEILQVVQRGLDIHVHGDENDPNRMLFNQCIQQHQIKLLFLLKALIQSLRHNFMRHSTIKMLFRYLARVTDCSCYNVNSFYKSSIYGVIKYWLQCSGEQIDAKTYEKLIEVIVKDITPNKSTLVLQINISNNSKSKGKNKNAVATASAASSGPNVNVETPRVLETQVANCRAALELLETLFKSVHINYKQTTCAQLFHVITSTLLDICANYCCPPYTSQECRLGLFKVLIATFDQHMHTIDIDLAANILALAQNSDDVELSLICQNGLKAIEKIVHPIQASIAPLLESVANGQEPPKEPAKSTTITVLSDFLIQSQAAATDDNMPDSQETNDEDNTETEDADNPEDISSQSEGTRKSVSVVEISDNEVEEPESKAIESEVVAIEEAPVTDEPVSKRRKADDQEVIYTFDLSQDALDSFVDEVN